MWLSVLGWVKDALGLRKLGGALTILAGVLVLGGAAIAFVRDEAVDKCNLEWKLKLSKEQEKLREKLAARDREVVSLQEQVKLSQEKEEDAIEAHKALLEKQREQVPLSEACTACRIPNERLWVRPTGGAPGRAQSRPAAKGS